MAIAKVREGVGNQRQKMKSIKVGDILVPLMFLFIFIILVTFVYIPRIKEVSEMRDEKKTAEEKVAALEGNLNKLQPLINDKVQLQRDLKVAYQVIPQELDVADFSFYVDELARDTGLDFKEITQQSKTSETEESNTNSTSSGRYVNSISGPIVYEGNFVQVVDFLDKLQTESPYIIEAQNIELKRIPRTNDEGKRVDSDFWKLELNITGYYIDEAADISISGLDRPMNIYTSDSTVLDTFKDKASILNE